MAQLKSVTILGKSMTGIECPFDTEEIWGVNNVAGQMMACPVCKGAGKIINAIPAGMSSTAPPETPCETCKGTGQVLMFQKGMQKLFAFDILPKEYTDGMKKYAPVCTWQDYGDIKYPIEEIIKEFKGTRYFTNTISYMLAYATYLRIPVIKIYGVDVTFGAAYAQENRGVEYWIGRAQERGLEVIVPPSSHLLRTVSGAMYGIRDNCNMLLYLHERINLINVLPKMGRYPDAIKAHNAWWVLFPKDDEAKANGVQINRDPQGNLSFNTPKEFLSDVHMPPETWEFLRNSLIDLEQKGQLPFGVISAYEKIVLGKEETK